MKKLFLGLVLGGFAGYLFRKAQEEGVFDQLSDQVSDQFDKLSHRAKDAIDKGKEKAQQFKSQMDDAINDA